LVTKLQGKELLRTPGHTQEDSVKVALKEVGLQGMDWIHLAQNRIQWQSLVNMVIAL
jgi:hypothetical protein